MNVAIFKDMQVIKFSTFFFQGINAKKWVLNKKNLPPDKSTYRIQTRIKRFEILSRSYHHHHHHHRLQSRELAPSLSMAHAHPPRRAFGVPFCHSLARILGFRAPLEF